MPAYYNEIDPYAAQWLRNLIKAGHIAPGEVDERDIADVRAGELNRYLQCHFFAGIGGWSYALRLAGWPDDRRVWTGSCPCQPFSSAGQRKGEADKRHLWPTFHNLIAERRPAIVFGEQVASADGREWLTAVRADLEALGYACGASGLCAAGIGAPHNRQRLWWVADSGLGYTAGSRSFSGTYSGISESQTSAAQERWGNEGRPSRSNGARSFWSDADWLPCTDGKARPVERGTFPLAYGIPARVAKFRAIGNAIVPQVAAEFIAAYQECEP